MSKNLLNYARLNQTIKRDKQHILSNLLCLTIERSVIIHGQFPLDISTRPFGGASKNKKIRCELSVKKKKSFVNIFKVNAVSTDSVTTI